VQANEPRILLIANVFSLSLASLELAERDPSH